MFRYLVAAATAASGFFLGTAQIDVSRQFLITTTLLYLHITKGALPWSGACAPGEFATNAW